MPIGRGTRRNGIGSCSGVDESIVRAFFNEQDDAGIEPNNNASSLELRGCQPRGGPLSLLASFITCWHPGRSSGSGSISASGPASPSTGGGKAWEKRKAAALLELSKQQQAALADKQDTIDMLEWQLEQLQMATSSLGVANDEEELLQQAQAIDHHNHHQPVDALLPNSPNNMNNNNNSDKENVVPSSNCAIVAPLPPSVNETSALVLLFEMAVVRARLSIRYFCNLFLKQMEASGYPVCRALAELEPSTGFIRKEHTAYVLDSKINKAFFHCFESESFDEAGITQILDPAKRCAAKLQEYRRLKCLDIAEAVNSKSRWFEPEFLRFCQSKTKEMWGEFGFSVVFRSVEERDSFTAAFLDVAKAVWLLHRLAFAVNPSVGIVRVGKGMEMNSLYVEPVAVPEQSCSKCGKSKVVEFMIMPGFRTQKKVIKCQVYQHVYCK